MEVESISTVTERDELSSGNEQVMECDVNKSEVNVRQTLRHELLDYLCQSKIAHFKSQQLGDPELEDGEKRSIAEAILDRSNSTFLARFGEHILKEHLDYFEECPHEEQYEVEFYLKRLRGNQANKRVKVRNRRFEALKQLVTEGSYFSEYEMKKRNPLLYDQLVGQFLTEDEERERTGIDTTNITFVNLLLEQYDRDEMKKLKKQQEEAEDDQLEESDDDDDIETDGNDQNDDGSCCKSKTNGLIHSNDMEDKEDEMLDRTTLWGETESMNQNNSPTTSYCNTKEPLSSKTQSNRQNASNQVINGTMDSNKSPKTISEEEMLTDDERSLLMDEFRSSMFNSFLQGKDVEFNYKDVDENSDYDDLEVRSLDEQDKYFDSESPEEEVMQIKEKMEEDDINAGGGEDEIDRYITTQLKNEAKNEENYTKLANKMEELHHN